MTIREAVEWYQQDTDMINKIKDLRTRLEKTALEGRYGGSDHTDCIYFRVNSNEDYTILHHALNRAIAYYNDELNRLFLIDRESDKEEGNEPI